jgi:hypothetical protein
MPSSSLEIPKLVSAGTVRTLGLLQWAALAPGPELTLLPEESLKGKVTHPEDADGF